MLVGALSYSGRFRGWFSDVDGPAHLVVGIDEVLRRLGGTARRWRVDRMATVIIPAPRGPAQLRAGRQALRRRGRSVPAAARQPQGRGREGDPLPDPAVVAHRPVASPTEAQASARPVLRRRSPMPTACRHALSASSPTPSRCSRCRRRPIRPTRRGDAHRRRERAGDVVGQPLLGPARPRRRPRAVRWRLGADTFDSSAPPACSSRRTGSHPAARSAPSGCPSTPRRWRTWCSARSAPTGPAAAKSTGRRQTPRSALAAELLGDRGADPVIDLDVYRHASTDAGGRG